MQELAHRLKTETHTKRYLVRPKGKVSLDEWNPDDTSGFDGNEREAEEESGRLTKRLEHLQGMVYAGHKHKILIVLQALDTAGKDGTIRRVFEGVNPQNVRVVNFKVPSLEERDHDFLWRVHKEIPGNGEVVIFNRSHYEGVLVERVHKLVPPEVWKARYEEINDFERYLCDEGTTIMKFYLNISKNEQKKRLEDRLKDRTKRWKFSENDLPEREMWSEYMKAYEEVLERTSTDLAPWYIVPANHNWFRDLVVSSVIVTTLQKMHLHYPKPTIDLKSIQIK